MKQLVLDANLTVLLIVGAADPRQIGVHRRLRAFEHQDFSLLIEVLGLYRDILVTPHILAETSNLMRHGQSPLAKINAAFCQLVAEKSEVYVSAQRATGDSSFDRLGLTDAGIVSLMDDQTELLTMDLDLHLEVLRRGFTSTNFNHLRGL